MYSMFALLGALGNSLKELEYLNKLIPDEGSKRDNIEIPRINVCIGYDTHNSPYIIIKESESEKTLEHLSEMGLILSEEPVRRMGSLLEASHFLGHEA